MKQIGWIGTGVMGASMAGRLIEDGYALTIFNRTRARAQALLDRGARWADSPAAAADGADVVATIVGYPHDVEDVILGESGVLAASQPPRIIIDFTTSSPDLAQRIAREAAARGINALDAPVSGGDIGARSGTLSIMVGGDETALDAIRPMLSHLGQKITHQGPPGSGQHTKMVNQILIATMMIGVCEGLLYAHRAGLDPLKVIEAVGSGAAGSWSINNLGPRIIKRDFAPGFYVEHFLKDMGIALAEARRMKLALPGLALAEQLYRAVEAHGHGRSGTQALMVALERLSGISGSKA
jgi:3-hydroxyisobutyrate dehydrogenase